MQYIHRLTAALSCASNAADARKSQCLALPNVFTILVPRQMRILKLLKELRKANLDTHLLTRLNVFMYAPWSTSLLCEVVKDRRPSPVIGSLVFL